MSNTSCSLHHAILSDVPVLAQISADAFATDRHTQMKYLGQPRKAISDMFSESFLPLFNRPARYVVLKATDNSTNEIAGSVCWAFHGYEEQAGPMFAKKGTEDEEDEQFRAKNNPEKGLQVTVQNSGHGSEHPTAEKDKNNSSQTPIQVLESITDQDMDRWMKILMPEGTRCMILVMIAVSPKYQSRGVGSALIRWGTSRADADGVFCWVHASDAGHKMFAKQGFKELGKLQVDLDEYASGPCEEEGTNGKWGKYIFRYLKRPLE